MPTVSAGEARRVAAPLLKHAAHTRVRVLNVVHRVIVTLRLCEIEIEVEVLIAFSQDVEETRRVIAHFMPQFAQRHEFAGSRGHRYFAAVSIQHCKLHHRHLEP